MRNHVMTGLLCLAASWAPVASASAAAMEWNTLFEAASGPPYPSSGRVEFGLREGLLLPAVQRSRIQVGLENVLGDGSVRLLLGLNRLPGNQILSEPVVTMSLSADFVPEPATAVLLGIGSVLLRGRRRDRGLIVAAARKP